MRLEVPLALARLFLAVALICLAWLAFERLFIAALAAALALDVAANHLVPPSRSSWVPRAGLWADLATRAAVPLGLHALRPYLLETEPFSFWTLVAAFAVPAAFAFVKYGRLPRYQTRASVVAVYLVVAATVFLLATGATWPLRLAALLLVVAQLEEIAVTAVLAEPQAPIRSLRAALRLRRGS